MYLASADGALPDLARPLFICVSCCISRSPTLYGIGNLLVCLDPRIMIFFFLGQHIAETIYQKAVHLS